MHVQMIQFNFEPPLFVIINILGQSLALNELLIRPESQFAKEAISVCLDSEKKRLFVFL